MGVRVWGFLLQGFGSRVPSLCGALGVCSIVPPRVGLAHWGGKRISVWLMSIERNLHGIVAGKGSSFVGSGLGSPGPAGHWGCHTKVGAETCQG